MRVLVAGGGPTGLTLAIDLARRGVEVRVVDKATEFFAGSRADGLQPRTLEVFADLGVLDAVRAAGIAVPVTRGYVDGEFVGEHRMIDPRPSTPDVPWPDPLLLGQSVTEGLLRDRLAEFGVRVELGTELTGLEQDAGGVRATLSHAGAVETVRVDYLVGADGGRSTVRRALGIAFTGYTDESLRVLLGDVSAEGLDHEVGHRFAGAGDKRRGIQFTPLAGGAQFQFGSPPPAADEPPSLAALQAVLDEVAGGREIRLHDLTWCTIWRPNVRLAEHFRRGRVFLAGDAAHAHPPTGGQGLNTGVQDAYNLGWKLAADDEELLASYEPERRAVAQRVLELSSALLRGHTDEHTPAEVAAHRDETTYGLNISYRGGPLAPPATGPGLAPGDRAPDAPLRTATGKDVRLFDLLRGPHATVLGFGVDPGPAPAGTVAHRVEPAGSGVEGALTDVDGHAARAYGVGPGTRVLIRPDGYLRSVEHVAPPA